MEHLTGLPLDRILKSERALPIRRVLRIVQQMCRSLSEAHDKGIVHRDLKPDNVFVGDVEGQKDYVKVLDFGVAKLREHAEGGTITQHGTIFGTPKYMSPEQCRSQEVDPRSDLYSVGVMMYEMVAGRVPFESENPLAILIMHAQDEVLPMSEVRPNLVVPFEVEELLHRLLAKEAEHRPQTAKEVIDRCQELLHQIPDMFEKVITYDNAEEEGVPFDKSQAYTIKNQVNESLLMRVESDQEQQRPTMSVENLPPAPGALRRRALQLMAVLFVLALGIGGWMYSQIQPLPATAVRVLPDARASGDVPPLEPVLVTVTFEANVDNVNIVNAQTGQVVGVIEKADTPVKLTWLREDRQVAVALRHGDADPIERAVTLSKDAVVEKAVFAPRVVADVETVTLTVMTNVGGAYVSIAGMDQVWPTPALPGMAREIAVKKGEASLEVTATKSGFLPATAAFVPSESGKLTLKLEPDPEAAGKEVPQVQVVITSNVGKVDVRLSSTGQLFRISKAKEPLTIPLPVADDELTLTFERRGYKTVEKTLVPNADAKIELSMERKRGGGGTPTAKTPKDTTPKDTVPKLNPIKKPKPKPKEGVGRLGRMKGGF